MREEGIVTVAESDTLWYRTADPRKMGKRCSGTWSSFEPPESEGVCVETESETKPKEREIISISTTPTKPSPGSGSHVIQIAAAMTRAAAIEGARNLPSKSLTMLDG